MKNTLKSLLVLVVVMEGLSGAAIAKNCDQVSLEVFPAELNDKAAASGLQFFGDKPVQLAIEDYQLEPTQNLVKVILKPKSATELSRLTGKYLEKRLAFVHNGKVVSSPVVKSQLEGKELMVSFDSEKSYQDFALALKSGINCSQ